MRIHVAEPLPESGFRASMDLARFPTAGRSGESLRGQVIVANLSDQVWPAAAWNATGRVVNLSYHWLALDGTVLVNDGLRTPLPFDLRPKRRVAFEARVALPEMAGRYLLEFDLVQEGVGWFASHGSPSARVVFEVTAHG
ncbi:MAG TPA: hypothetical protein VFZ57_09605 [Thermoanaerobaculia bacterium]|nr:hypothetical protein [Thermoanaerobaculia bacterium]